jgi:hypothetical protein
MKPVWADAIFTCHSELSSGFKKKDGSWKTTTFSTQVYTIIFNDDFTIMSGLHNNDQYVCKYFYSVRPHYIACINENNFGKNFIFNTKTFRFVNYSGKVTGYIFDEGEKNKPDSDSISAGTCEKMK